MEVTQNQNQFKPVQYWMPLYTFYGKMSNMSITLVDSEGSVQFKITPAIQGMENVKPTEGVKKFDYSKSIAITLSLSEIMSIITGYKTGAFNQTQVTFYHKVGDDPSSGKSVGIIGGISTYEGRILFGITDQRKNLNNKFFFSASKFGQQGSEVYIQSELSLFISILESVVSNLVLIKSKTLPAYVPKGDGNRQQNGYQNSGYQQPAPQQTYQQPVQNSGYQQSMAQPTSQPAPQQNYNPNPAPMNNGVPQSIDTETPSPFDF